MLNRFYNNFYTLTFIDVSKNFILTISKIIIGILLLIFSPAIMCILFLKYMCEDSIILFNVGSLIILISYSYLLYLVF
jgi:hypothetical protein